MKELKYILHNCNIILIIYLIDFDQNISKTCDTH